MKKLLASFTLATASLLAATPAAHAVAPTSITLTGSGQFTTLGNTNTHSFAITESSLFSAAGSIATFEFAPLNSLFSGVFTAAELWLGSDQLASWANPLGATTFSLSSALAATGSYELKVTGKATGGAGTALYTFSGSVSPVPEPESYAMMLAGLAVMGAIARKRNQNKA